MELLKLEDYDNLKKEKIQSEMADRRWKKYKKRGRKMTPKEIKQYQDRYPKSGVYGFKKQNKY